MFYYLSQSLWNVSNWFNVFRYITVRSGLAMVTAFVVVAVAGPATIRWLSRLKAGQVIRDDGPSTHQAKAGTPTMGGVLIVAAIIIGTLLWAEVSNPYVIAVTLVTVGYGAVGFADDYLKVRRQDSKGLRGRYKIVLEAAIGLIAILILSRTWTAEYHGAFSLTQLMVPFFKNFIPDLGLFFLIYALIVIMGSANAVNLTDGLDGLAIMPVVLVALAYAVFSYVVARHDTSQYLYIPFVRGASEMTVFCAAIMGAGLGFLWYNCHPAEVFMGDVGALSLGGALGMVAVATKHELVLLIVGAIFVAEALSVILQVGYFKFSHGKRIFRMAPLHHHFEEIGWDENKVIVRFWIVQILLVLFGLATLKLR